MTTAEDRQADIIELLLDDHRTVAHLFDSFDGDLGIQRREGLFRQLTTTLVQHEVAEEITVYPLLRKLGDAGEAQADARIAEQSEAESLLRSMERLDVMSDAFMRSFDELRAVVLRHAHAEENEVFPYSARCDLPPGPGGVGTRVRAGTAERSDPPPPPCAGHPTGKPRRRLRRRGRRSCTRRAPQHRRRPLIERQAESAPGRASGAGRSPIPAG